MDITNGLKQELAYKQVKSQIETEQELALRDNPNLTPEQLQPKPEKVKQMMSSAMSGIGCWFSGVFQDHIEDASNRSKHSLFIGTTNGPYQDIIMKDLYGWPEMTKRLMPSDGIKGELCIYNGGSATGGGVCWNREFPKPSEKVIDVVTVTATPGVCQYALSPDNTAHGYIHTITVIKIPMPKP